MKFKNKIKFKKIIKKKLEKYRSFQDLNSLILSVLKDIALGEQDYRNN